jgi:predicted RNA-binding Zn ribbon-like protein
MPEHRPGTPPAFVTLESFLWWDFRDSGDWEQWAKKWGLASSDRAARRAYEKALVLQGALRQLELANNGALPDAKAIRTVNELIDELEIRPKVSTSGGVALASCGRSVAGPIAALLIMVLDAMTAGVWHRFKLCRDPTCSASFYDASKSATKIWCSMGVCGSRSKMRRLRQRRKSAAVVP